MPKRYPSEFRARALALVQDGKSVAEVAGKLGITSPETLRRWVIQARVDLGSVVASTKLELAEIKELREVW